MVLQPLQDPLSCLSPSERTLFHRFGTGEVQKTPFSCVHHAFECYARLQPDTPAVVNFQESITYGELDRQANCLAAHLIDWGVRVDSRVCVLVERSILMVVAMLGVLKAGAAYIPFDGNVVSDSTLAHALKDSGSDVVLTLPKFMSRVAGEFALNLEDILCQTSSEHCVKPKDLATADSGAYVIYTSG